ncbi:MAG: PTS sugar transporter subunit IIA [Desulfurella sp.]|jgi:PTS system nitrogen regulatory IIA component|uniref:PTS system, nitrogen regulatory IIA component n=1 Tax=Desulfurella multipotens TaxID=79269 RepID=A0A1G6MHQ7_9BACT|nr:PTS sugar transporter subunit IIA [Desulfurella multipotens]AHF96898.1 nitrogen regulatory protein [Desulfurella acetivorans A63]PMP66606.1 MAG: PTS fructose transporter subunit IIA [Desulfurella multipotens]SDC55062.1 PTS system, nitrogen regulatory IIA component [Desulfurella multipotens]
MDFKDLLSQINDVEVDIYAKDKFELFQKISQYLASKINVDSSIIYDLLRERELLGSTAIGNGFALPHLKLKGIKPYIGIFVLKTPLDFDSIDNMPVSVVFVVLSPSEKPSLQLKTLTLLAKMLKNVEVDSFLNKNPQEIKNYLNNFKKNE